jgi:glycerophosphoryl diester phosphodiesterase
MLGSVLRDLRASWFQLAVVDSIYKLLALLVLWPVWGLALRLFVELSGRDELADDDIVSFLLGPIGWAACLVIGAMWVAILVLQQAALLELLVRRDAGSSNSKDGGIVASLWSTSQRSTGVVRLAIQVTLRLFAVAVPFLAIGGGLYWWLLTEHDINYYLDVQPPVFLWAVVSIGLTLAVLALVLGALIVRWSYALPLVLFEKLPAAAALAESSSRSIGRRRPIVGWIVRWAIANAALAALALWLIAVAGQYIVPYVAGRWPLLMLSIGALVGAWTLAHFALSILGTSSLAAVLLNLYREVGRSPEALAERVQLPSDDRRLAGRHIVLGLLAAVIASIGVGAGAMIGVRLDDDTQITAHRAGAASAPENSVAACEQAIADGTDWIEIDVQETADGEVVVIHDRDLMKLGGSPLNVWNSTAADLRAVDVGSAFDPKFSDVRLATLGEMLDAAKKGGIGVVIELKHYGHAQRLEERVAEIVEAHGMVDDIVIMSLGAASLRRMRELRPNWIIGRLTAVPVTDLTKQDVDFLAVSIRNATNDFIRRCHRRKKDVYVWTVNDAPTMFEMASRGADNLITDNPALARDVLDQRENMGPIDRLFFEIAQQLGTLPAHMYHDAEL